MTSDQIPNTIAENEIPVNEAQVPAYAIPQQPQTQYVQPQQPVW